jgi:hypothetical protein
MNKDGMRRNLNSKRLLHWFVLGVALAFPILTTCDLFKTSLGDKVDISKPEVSVSSPTANAYVKDAVTLSGATSDDIGVASVVISYLDQGGIANAVTSTLSADKATSATWSVTIPITGGDTAIADGGQTFTITATDTSGKTTIITHFLYIDNKPPVVLINTPQGYGNASDRTTVSNFLDVEGKAYDLNGSPISSVVVTIANSSGTVLGTKTATGDNSWSARFVFGTDLTASDFSDNGIYRILVAVTDAAGNVNTYCYHEQDIWNLLGSTGSVFPSLAEIAAMDQKATQPSFDYGSSFTVANLITHRVNDSNASTPTYVDFAYSADGNKPVIVFSNIDTTKEVLENKLASQAPVSGYVRPGPAGTAVDSSTITAYYQQEGASDWTKVDSSSGTGSFEVSSVNGYFYFNAYLKNASGYLSNGKWAIKIVASSKSGSSSSSVCNFYIDSSAPSVTVTPTNGTKASYDKDVTKMITVTKVIVTDDNSLIGGSSSILSISAYTSYKNGAYSGPIAGSITLPTPTTSGDGKTATFSGVQIPLSDAEYATVQDSTANPSLMVHLAITASDLIGTATTSHIDYSLDANTPADPVIISPVAGDYVSGNYLSVAGTADSSDTNPIDAVYFIIDTAASSPAFSTGTWTAAAGVNNWNKTVDISSKLEGTYYLYALSWKSSGKVSGIVSKKFYIDRANPRLNVRVQGEGTYNNTAKYNANGSVTLEGIADDAALTTSPLRTASSFALAYSFNGTKVSDVDLATNGWTPSTGAWSWNLPISSGDGLYSVDFIVTDEANKKTSFSRTIQVDGTAPTLTVTSPSESAPESIFGSQIDINVAAYDAGVGFGPHLTGSADFPTIEYSFNGSSWNSLVAAPTTTNANGSINTSLTLSAYFGTTEGEKTLYLRSHDRLGNLTSKNVKFWYDTAAPTLSVKKSDGTGGSTETFYTKTDITFNQVASDTTDGMKNITLSVNGGTAQSLAGTETNTAYTFSTASNTEGTYTLKFIATDVAGRTTSLTRTVIYDKTLPTLSGITNLTGGWRTSSSASVTGSANDPGSGSGIDYVKYRISNDNGTTWSSWSNFSGTTSFSGTVAFSDGSQNILQIVAVDKSGNESAVSSQTVEVDTVQPMLAITTSTVPSVSNNNDCSVAFGVTEDTSGVSIIEWDIGSSTFATGDNKGSASFTGFTPTITIAHAKFGASTIVYYRTTDAAGNVSPVVHISVNVDTVRPTVSVTSPNDGASVNKTITISGTANDTNGLASTAVQIYNNSTGLWESAGAISGSAYAWSRTLDTTAYTNGGNYDIDATSAVKIKLRALATDVAANDCLDDANNTRALVVDQNSDRPVVKVTSLSADGGILKYGTDAEISGSVSDDDSSGSAAVLTFIASGSAITSTAGYTSVTASGVTTTSSANGTTTYTASTGEWSFKPNSTGDGEKTVYFYVVDNNSTVFYTGQATLTEPYIQFKSSAKTDNGTAITYKSDSNAPSISSVGASYGSTTALGTSASSLSLSLCLGGPNNRYLSFVSKASDANGIQYITLDYTDANSNKISLTTSSAYDGTRTQSGSFTETHNSTVASWTTGVIDLSSLPTGSLSLTVTAYDQCGLYGNSTSTFYLDNSGPTVNVLSPLASDEVTGSVAITGTTADSGNAGVASISWLVPTTAQQALGNAAVAALTGWQSTMASGATNTLWEFDFNGSNATTNPMLTRYDSENIDGNTYYSSLVSGIYTLPIYFKVTDALGNYTIYRSYSAKHNPDGDKPVTKITYPATAFITLGGTIRVNGTATDNVSVNRVYLRIDWDGDGDFDSADQTYATSSGFYTSAITSYASSGITSGVDAGEQTSWWGIKASNTTGWSINLNGNNELDPTASFHISGNTDLRDVRIQACSVDNNNKAGAWTDPITIRIDKNAPRIGSSALAVNQYAGTVTLADFTSSSVPSATDSATYLADMYLKGQWYLVASVEDESGISSCSIKKGTTVQTAGTDYKAIATSWSTTSGYLIYLPIDKTTEGQVEYTITAVDSGSTPHTTEMTYTLKIDNTAPTMTSLMGNSVTITSATPVQNNNFRYVLSADATDTGSGFSKALFYFLRSPALSGHKARVYDPEIAYNATYDAEGTYAAATSLSHSRTNVEDINSATEGSGTVYGKDYTRTGSSDTVTTFTSTGISTNAHIRTGGLIKIGGSYRLITAVSSNTVTFTPGTPISNTAAFFPYAQVADNTGAEGVSWNSGLYTLTNDDGDNMPESVSKSGTTWSWNATLYSNYLSDGPITIVCLAFDKAGNVSSQTVTTTVQNNRPRLSKMYLGTDLNEDSVYSDSEFETYDLYHVSGDYQTAYTLTTAAYKTYSAGVLSNSSRPAFKVKNKLAAVPEFTGGNGTISLVYTRDASAISTYQTGTVTAPGSSSLIDSGNTTVLNSATIFSLANATLAGNASFTESDDGVNKAMGFTFWDSTDETTPGTNSNNAFLKVSDFTLDLTDSVKPYVVIDPFKWTDLTHNSIYGSSSATDISSLNGHIELPAELPPATFSSSNTLEYDLDPKVSGKITITGSAYDDQRLESLWVCFDGFTPTAGTYLATDSARGDSKTYYELAKYNTSGAYAGTWTYAATLPTMATHYYDFTVTPDYLDQSGHRVTWTLDIDTAQITNKAAADVRLRVEARDHATTNWSSYKTYAQDNTVSTFNVPYYQMDVVPYIKGVKTSLSTLKKTNSSVYDRTALGHYPVKSDTSAYFYGFNFAAAATASDSAATAHTAALGSADTTTYTGYTVYPATVSAFTSGNVSITVNTMVSLNNLNLNDAKGSYTGTTSAATGNYAIYSNYYNRQPNNDNNNNLTDDVVLDVWKVKNSARSHSGTLTEPIMRIVPTATDTASDKDVMRFAFTNGADYFSMASAADKVSYQDWQRNYADFNNVAFAYDIEGNSYGITTGLDTYPATTTTFAGRFTFMSSRWGICNTGSRDDNYYGQGKLRLEAIGIMKGANVLGTALNDDYVMDTRRFSSPVLATAVHGAGTGTSASTSIYLAYYDKFQKQIRFRYGTFNTTAPSSTDTNHSPTADGNFNQFKDQHAQADTNFTNNDSSTAYYWQNNKYAFDAALTDYSLIAGKSAVTTPVDTGNVAGKYVAIDVVPGTTTAADVVVVVWYNGSNLQYSYKLNPYNDNDADQSHASASGYWSTPKTIFTDGGRYCAIKVDSAGGIHIAAQDSSNQDLKYAYLSSYSAAYSEATNAVTVDSYAIVGTQIQIDTQSEGGKIIPYISYFNGSTVRPKMAYLVPQTTMDYTASGSDATTEMLTGKWEVTLVPTGSEVQDDHMNIGLWKTKTGVKRVNMQTGTDSVISGTGYSYGNGTGNPVVGYATVDGTQGYIETAQKQ